MTALDNYCAALDGTAVNRVERRARARTLRRLSLTTREGGVNVAQLRADLERAWPPVLPVFDRDFGNRRPRSSGQCVPTALVVQRLWGGEVLVIPPPRFGLVRRQGGQVVRLSTGPSAGHAWNRLENGRELDLTADAFDPWEPEGEPWPWTAKQLLAHPEAALPFTTLWRRLCDIWTER